MTSKTQLEIPPTRPWNEIILKHLSAFIGRLDINKINQAQPFIVKKSYFLLRLPFTNFSLLTVVTRQWIS